MEQITNRRAWDQRYADYYQLGDVFATVAEHHCGIRVDETTRLRWRELMGIMREIDTFADENAENRASVGQELRSFTHFAEDYPHLTPEVLGSPVHEKLVSRTERILQLGELASRVSAPYRYMCLRAAEAVQTAEVFADSATPYVAEQSAFSLRFMPLARQMGIASCFLDSAKDARRDFLAGQSSVNPTVRYRLQLLGGAASRLPALSWVALHRPVMRQLQIAAIRHFVVKRAFHRNT